MPWRPLSQRDQPDLAEPYGGVPAHLQEPLAYWVIERFREAAIETNRALTTYSVRAQLDPPLTPRANNALADLRHRMYASEDMLLNTLDYVLYHLPRMLAQYDYDAEGKAVAVERLLRDGRSIWTVALLPEDDGGFARLQHRSVGPVAEAIGALSPSTRAHHHLVDAWNKSAGRDTDPTGAYREAVRAVEAVAKPVILPNNPKATLGTMIPALRDKPEKWTSVLFTVNQVRELMQVLWREQFDRHGTDDEDVPLNVSPEEAETAVHTALLLTKMFVSGDVRLLDADDA